jgi:hypothetical protein
LNELFAFLLLLDPNPVVTMDHDGAIVRTLRALRKRCMRLLFEARLWIAEDARRACVCVGNRTRRMRRR